MTKPNILLLLADQWRFDWVGYLGCDLVDTPNLDALAKRAMVFTNCCTNSPVCAPARIALATGQHGGHTGAVDNACFMSDRQTTYYQRLRDADYQVGLVGKLDLAKPTPYNGRDGQRPCLYKWGFTHPMEVEGKMHAGRGNPPIGPYTNFLQERGLLKAFCDDYDARRSIDWSTECHDSVLPTDAFADHFIGQRSVEWLQKQPTDFPWHLAVHFVGPHDPFDPPTEYADRYREAPMPAAVQDKGTDRGPMMKRRMKDYDPEVVTRTRRQYAAAIAAIDDQVGEIIQALKDRGEYDSTYIVFSADHGEMLGDLGMYTKSVPYDPALKVPLFIAGPGIEGGTQNDSMVELADLNPTFCEWAGLPPQGGIDACSICPTLADASVEHRDIALSCDRGFRLVRNQTHKFVLYDTGERELYDLQADPEENNNIIKGNKDLVQPLHERLKERWYRDAAGRFG